MKTVKERVDEIDYVEEKLGDVISQELEETTPYERGYGVIQTLSMCETYEELKILDETLTALCGHGIEYLVNLTEVR